MRMLDEFDAALWVQREVEPKTAVPLLTYADHEGDEALTAGGDKEALPHEFAPCGQLPKLPAVPPRYIILGFP